MRTSRYRYHEAEPLEKTVPLKKDMYLPLVSGQSTSISFCGSDIDFHKEDDREYKLYFTGETDIPWEYRCEPQYPVLYRRICESLIPAGDGYQLHIASDKGLPRMAFYRANEFPADIKTLEFSCDVTGVVYQGDCRFEIEVYYKNGQPRFAFHEDAEIKQRIPIQGTCTLRQTIPVDKEIDFILVGLRLDDFCGELTVASPKLTDESGNPYIPPFTVEPLDLEPKQWVGINLSKIEWPHFVITLNGSVIYDGTSFERIHRWPSHQFLLPKELFCDGRNEIKIQYIGDYPQPLDYILRDVSLLISPTEQGIIACEPYAAREFGVLIKLKEDSVVTAIASCPQIQPVLREQKLSKGLHVIPFQSEPFAGKAVIQISIGGKAYTAELSRYIQKDSADVIVGTGDQIYSNLTYPGAEEFVSWYLHNRLGKLFTFRTTYRWSGTDHVDEGLYDWLIDLLGQYGVYSAIMTDGRELPNLPSNEKGYFGSNPYFLGYQAHEQDGMFLYWGAQSFTKEGAFYQEIVERLCQCQGGDFTPGHTLFWRGENVYQKHFDSRKATDMQAAAEYFVKNISRIRYDASRHSGPSILFKYFFDAGVKWCSAELMYNCVEVITGALRGASLANGQKSYGGHMAVQWSTTPHDDIYRYRRFFNAMLLAYTNGIDQINMEEGCWRLEECYADFERNSSPCLQHTAIQRAVNDFAATHTRRGELKTNIAILQGKYDGLDMFTHPDATVWRMDGVPKGASESSWDLLEVFYPHAKLGCVYEHNCPHEPVGFHTGTPYGLVDIIPDYASSEFMARYPYLIMLGYHCNSYDFNNRLLQYVKNGGTVLATLAHFTDCTDHKTANAGQGKLVDTESFRKLTGGYTVVNTQQGQRLADADGAVHSMIHNTVGKGRVILFNTTAYPAHDSIRTQYKGFMEALAQQNARQEKARGWAETKDWVTTSIFDAEDRRTIYCMNVNWWSDEEPVEQVTLHNDGYCYTFPVERDTVCIASIFGETVFVAQSMTLDVLGYDGKTLRVQGSCGDEITVFRKGQARTVVLPLSGIYETQLNEDVYG